MRNFSIGSKYKFCPNGNYWQDVTGVFDDAIYLFCDCNICNGQVYKLKPFNVTKKVAKEVIKRIRQENKRDSIRDMITFENMDKVEQIISTEK